MSRHPLTPITVRERNKRKRIINWALFYIAVIGFFGYFIYQQAININTLDFAHGTLQLTTPKTKYNSRTETRGLMIAQDMPNKVWAYLTRTSR